MSDFPAPKECPGCNSGIAYAIGHDESGTHYHCFTCGHRFAEAAEGTESGPGTGIGGGRASEKDLRIAAREQGIDPDKFRSADDLAYAVRDAQSAAESPSSTPQDSAASLSDDDRAELERLRSEQAQREAAGAGAPGGNA